MLSTMTRFEGGGRIQSAREQEMGGSLWNFAPPLAAFDELLPAQASQHEGLLRGLCCPDGASPECIFRVAKQGHSEAALRMPGLPGRAKSVDEKG